MRMILDALTENRGVQVEFYNRFQYTVEVCSCHGLVLRSRALPLLKQLFSSIHPQTLLQFFHARGEGLSVDDMKSGDYKVRPLLPQLQPRPSGFLPVLSDCLLFQVLDEELRLNKCSSFELIEQYYLEKISHQVCNQADNFISLQKRKRIDFTYG